MEINRWLSAFPQFLVLLPSAASCYYTMKNQLRYTPRKTVILSGAVLISYSILCSCFCTLFRMDVNTLFLLSLVLFFFIFRRMVISDLPRCLAVYVGVCAVQAFPAQFAYSFDAFLHPTSGMANFSPEAAFFQLGISCLIAAVFAWPASQYFFQGVDSLDFPRIWYSTVIFSAVFFVFNKIAVPKSYATIHTGRMFFLFLLLEICLFAVLIAIYVLFYWSTTVILEHAELKERAQIFEMQSRQYQTLQEHMRQTARLRHDFRHGLRLISSLAEKGDMDSIRKYLADNEASLTEGVPVNYCANAAMNALFGYYHEMAVSAGVDTDWHIELPNPLSVTETDMASLLGNLIENAIQGCLTVPENRRYFCLTTEIRHGASLYIVSTNSFDGKIRKGADGYRSTKHSGQGTGLVSIAAVAEKYGGQAQISNSDSEFCVDVVLEI